MFLTESEARQKKCPFAPLSVIASVQCGETPAFWESWCGCTASECMAWRWGVEFEMEEPPQLKGFAAFMERLMPTRGFPGISSKQSSRGYCGLAGRGDAQ